MSDDRTIGQRIRTERLRRGRTLAVIAGQAGISVGHLSKMERGLERCDRRSTLGRLADALGVSVGVLTGQPVEPTDPIQMTAQARIPALRLAFMDTDLDDHHTVTPVRSLEELGHAADLVGRRRQDCDFAAVMGVLPDLVVDLHTATQGRSARAALRLLLGVCHVASLTAKDLGHPELAWIAAARAVDAAERLGDQVAAGAAEFTRSHALFNSGAYDRGRRRAQRAADVIPRATPEGMQVYGALTLTAAMGYMAVGGRGDAEDLVDEAAQVAFRTGQGNAYWLLFGPANVNLWRVSLALEAGEGRRAVDIARRFDPSEIPATSRQAAYWIDVGRAHAQIRGQEHAAVAALRHAEDLAPQRVRANPFVRDTLGVLLRRARAAAGGLELQRMATRLGVS